MSVWLVSPEGEDEFLAGYQGLPRTFCHPDVNWHPRCKTAFSAQQRHPPDVNWHWYVSASIIVAYRNPPNFLGVGDILQATN